MNLDDLRAKLEAAGARISNVEAGNSRALVLQRLPDKAELDGAEGDGALWVVDGEIHDLLEPGCHARGGTLRFNRESVAVSRVSAPGLRAVRTKVGEDEGNLERRADWFKKRSGG